jgi:hypothetical protein
LPGEFRVSEAVLDALISLVPLSDAPPSQMHSERPFELGERLTDKVALYVGRRHQPHRMANRLEFARPMMRRGAGLDADQAPRQLLEERQYLTAPYLPADNYVTLRINAVDRSRPHMTHVGHRRSTTQYRQPKDD